MDEKQLLRAAIARRDIAEQSDEELGQNFLSRISSLDPQALGRWLREQIAQLTDEQLFSCLEQERLFREELRRPRVQA